MDPRQLITQAAIDDDYEITGHALAEADKDGISLDMIEGVMKWGIRKKIEKMPNDVIRYTLGRGGIFISAEVSGWKSVTIITTGREK